MGQHMEHFYNTTRKSASGFVSNISVYRATNCEGCPLRCLCQISVNHTLREYKRIARERLTSQEGIRMRKKRPIEPEVVFGQMKNNKSNHRFRHIGKEMVAMDFAIFAIAFNLLKLSRITTQNEKNAKNTTQNNQNKRTFFVLAPSQLNSSPENFK